MKINSFEDLDCWQEARILVRKIYDATKEGNFKKDLRLTGQIQGAATSSMANIAEGFIRRSDKEFIQFLYIRCPHPRRYRVICMWLWTRDI